MKLKKDLTKIQNLAGKGSFYFVKKFYFDIMTNCQRTDELLKYQSFWIMFPQTPRLNQESYSVALQK